MPYKFINKYDFEKVDDFINNKRIGCKEFDRLFDIIEDMGQVIIIGGAIRDIILKDKIPRDIDIIVDTPENLDKLLCFFDSVSKNRFSGYKIKINDIDIDIWSLDSHWAFKNRILSKSIDNIMFTTFLNIDSLVYDYSNKKSYFELFNESIRKRSLDITLNDEYIYENPTIEINVLRMLILEDEWEIDASTKVRDYICKWVTDEDNPISALCNTQRKHYRNCIKISEERIKQKIESIIGTT